jgi:hypothetical protein
MQVITCLSQTAGPPGVHAPEPGHEGRAGLSVGMREASRSVRPRPSAGSRCRDRRDSMQVGCSIECRQSSEVVVRITRFPARKMSRSSRRPEQAQRTRRPTSFPCHATTLFHQRPCSINDLVASTTLLHQRPCCIVVPRTAPPAAEAKVPSQTWLLGALFQHLGPPRLRLSR